MAILVGTASWTDKSLIDCKRFYPADARTAEARLRFYATRFPMVEVDSSYYALPSVTNSQLWLERTPADFVFNIKAFRLFTGHQTAPSVLPKDLQDALPALARSVFYYRDLPADLIDELWRRFLDALAPLQQAGKLKAVHFQFAPWVVRNRAGHAHVRECVERMAGQQVAVEFRNESWFRQEAAQSTLDFERELGVAHVVVDGPRGFSNSVPPVWAQTTPALALLRLHGRNQEAWNRKGVGAASDRFNYDYSDAELAGLVPAIEALAQKVQLLQIVFNNNHEDQGQRNARTMMQLLGLA